MAKAESDVCSWLREQGLLLPDPFDDRLDGSGRAHALRRLISDLGARYQLSTFDNYEIYHDAQAEVVARLRRFAAGMPDHCRGGGLMLFGDAGTGKDHLIAALLKLAVAAHGLSVAWYDGGALYDRLAIATRDENPDALRRLQAELMAPHVVAISDPQPPSGELSASQVRRLRDVIDRRYRETKSTWMTTNIDRKSDAERLLTEPLMQRLKEGAGQILCDWPSYRLKKKASW